ncbi:MAG: hypothetical protein K9J83_08385 [Desulfarculaceae bacterium]|nr:hypothetical protein [Desulfarculaceae bacterium]
MTSERHNVVFRGRIFEGADPQKVKEHICSMFRIDMEKTESLFSGKKIIIKKHADEETCRKMKLAFAKAGADCEIEKAGTGDPKPAVSEGQGRMKTEDDPGKPGFQSGSGDLRPSEQASDEQQARMATNPYSTPSADLVSGAGMVDAGFTGPRKVPAGNGAGWIFAGFGLFRKNPISWIFSTIVFFVVSGLIQVVPFLGAIAANLLNPVFGAGFIMGAAEQDAGDDFSVRHLFAGFSNNFGRLILFALVFFFGAFLVMALLAVVMFTVMAGGLAAMQNPALFMNMSPVVMVLFFLILTAFMVPMAMVYWFSPALIALNDLSFFDAMKMSLRACLMNILPFLVYGAVFLLIGVVVTGLAAVVIPVTVQAGKIPTVLAVIPLVVIGLAVTPVAIASIYTSYRDIFQSG